MERKKEKDKIKNRNKEKIKTKKLFLRIDEFDTNIYGIVPIFILSKNPIAVRK